MNLPRSFQRCVMVGVLLVASFGWGVALAATARPAAADPVLDVRAKAIAVELRCLVCQNQTLADSDADLAVDLRAQIHRMLAQGQTDEQVRQFMIDRYGDFILYRPPVNASTAFLWFGPGILAVLGLGWLGWVLRQRSRMQAQVFDPDDEGGDHVEH
jgi:cytochrome c-type biogenesis protein CcmH